MSRINCHSAFKHYEMFHSRGGDVINIGSNNTTIFNCGGSHLGGFWGGFGLGLGNAFGSLFGGGMGFGGFGMDGFGFPGFGGFGNFGFGNVWGNNALSSTPAKTSSNTTCNCKGCHGNDNANNVNDKEDDKDQPKLSELIKKVTGFKTDKAKGKNVDPEAVDEVRKQLEALKDKPVDDINGSNNKDHYARLLDDLNKNFPKADGTDDSNSDDGTVGANEFNNSLNAAGNDSAKLLALLDKTTDPAQRAQIKAKFYEDGYSNYDGKTELKDGDVVIAHDNSGKTRDTKQASGKAQSTITKSDNGSHPQTIVIHDSKDITYTYKETVDGEYIYTSDQDNQEYVLQKNTNGKYDLMQYNYHKGYGVKDWS